MCSSGLKTNHDPGSDTGTEPLEFIAAYNLLVHLVRQSHQPDIFLPKICQNLKSPIPSSPSNAAGLALSILTTIFNLLPQDSPSRYHVFLTVIKVIGDSSSFDALKPQLKNLDGWLVQWDIDEGDQKKLYLSISEVADKAGEKEQACFYLLRALRSIPASDSNTKEVQGLSAKALRLALSDPRHFDFQDLTALDSVQSLRESDPPLFQLLEIFNSETMDDFQVFVEEHAGWIEERGMDQATLARKMRLLTLASLAAKTQSRALPYKHISDALQISLADVEMWVIDVIRAGLVEGKLSQLNQTFLIQRSTYRVFGEKQWAEVAGRLDTWRTSLEGVLAVIRQEREKVLNEREREFREIDGKFPGQTNGMTV